TSSDVLAPRCPEGEAELTCASSVRVPSTAKAELSRPTNAASARSSAVPSRTDALCVTNPPSASGARSMVVGRDSRKLTCLSLEGEHNIDGPRGRFQPSIAGSQEKRNFRSYLFVQRSYPEGPRHTSPPWGGALRVDTDPGLFTA